MNTLSTLLSGRPRATISPAAGREPCGPETVWANQDQNTPEHDSRGVFRCPAASHPQGWPIHLEYEYYGYNYDGLIGPKPAPPLGLGKVPLPDGAIRPVKEGEVTNPAEMVAIGDAFTGWAGEIVDGEARCGRDARPPLSGAPAGPAHVRVARRHGGRGNVTFCDGHVTGLSLTFMFVDTNDTALRLWNRDDAPHADRLLP